MDRRIIVTLGKEEIKSEQKKEVKHHRVGYNDGGSGHFRE
jgi:hypothetical protein